MFADAEWTSLAIGHPFCVASGLGLPSELVRLPGFERRYGASCFAYRNERFAAAEPGRESDNRLRSLNLTFINLG
jgi:hypothetical protein